MRVIMRRTFISFPYKIVLLSTVLASFIVQGTEVNNDATPALNEEQVVEIQADAKEALVTHTATVDDVEAPTQHEKQEEVEKVADSKASEIRVEQSKEIVVIEKFIIDDVPASVKQQEKEKKTTTAMKLKKMVGIGRKPNGVSGIQTQKKERSFRLFGKKRQTSEPKKSGRQFRAPWRRRPVPNQYELIQEQLKMETS